MTKTSSLPRVRREDRVALFRKVADRIVMAFVVLLLAMILTFVALHSLPGDPVLALLGGPMAAPSPEEIAIATHELGLDKPLCQQFLHYIAKLLSGDLGTSSSQHVAVSQLLAEQIGPTVILTLSSLGLAWIYAIVSVVLTANRNRHVSGIGSAVETCLSSLPQSWISLLLLFTFSFAWHLFPPSGNSGIDTLVLPALALGLPMGGYIAQIVREGFGIAMEQPFVLASRLRGQSDIAIRLRHVLRHAILPGISISAWAVGALVGNAVLVELIFSRRGLGRSLYGAVSDQDMPLAIGVTLVVTLVYIVGGLIADLVYVTIDPRKIEGVQ